MKKFTHAEGKSRMFTSPTGWGLEPRHAGKAWVVYFLALIILTVSNVVSVMLETFKAILITIFKKKSEIGLCVIEVVSFMLVMGITGQ
ncbi:hypothetical protein [Vibrio sp. Evd11]|uniref:hypothetical protein n=1 Tax=Vibrio sp. Evd11 TaxID=1207404 RepID=UPI0020B1752B|nr:hypothetical protein [Vibrio sp. Evd11]